MFFANLKKSLQNKFFIGDGCPAHIINNCILSMKQTTLYFDIETIISILCTENLKEYCEFAERSKELFSLTTRHGCFHYSQVSRDSYRCIKPRKPSFFSGKTTHAAQKDF
ncbi:unnamed protein product [Lepeophtheirus salmonis]|uniref:(salmon louse) hypothetical protein n=1 Tax=Lepeophtheirus salmonis TaxID=72036 RepID=A0A7R8HB06_LEPSM|nr:unnamed protein product [Lepeophtheirus salmonis]CAF2974223.1 unnamed protein product [Lepeophtheirus salmonis]